MLVKYSKNFLTQVIFQANYNIPSIKFHLDSTLKDLCRLKTGQDPKELKNTNVNFSVNSNSNQAVTTEMNSRWLFQGSELQIIIQYDLIQIVNLNYTDYTHFHGIITEIFNKVKDIYKPVITRIALRYINNINFPTGSTYDFAEYIDEALLNSSLKFKDYGLKRSIGQMQLAEDENDLSVNFTYGFNNSQYPNKLIKREFLLDYDCFLTYKSTSETVLDISDIILKIRNKVNQLFEKSILSGLQKQMH